jgi:hypothetical protein
MHTPNYPPLCPTFWRQIYQFGLYNLKTEHLLEVVGIQCGTGSIWGHSGIGPRSWLLAEGEQMRSKLVVRI